MAYIHQLIENRVIVTKTITTKKQNKKRYGEFIKSIFILMDLICLNFISIGIVVFSGLVLNNFYFIVFFNLSWLFLNFFIRRNNFDRNIETLRILFNDLKLVFIHFLFIASFSQFIFLPDLNILNLGIWYLVFLPGLAISRIVLFFLLIEYRKQGYNYRKIAIVGGGPIGHELHEFIKNNLKLGYKFCGIFDEKVSQEKSDLYKGNIEDLFNYCSHNKVDDIFCALSSNKSKEIHQIMEFADNNLIRFRLIPDFKMLFNPNKKIDLSFYDGIPVLTPRHEPLENVHNRLIKRGFDIFFSFFMITICISLILPLLAILIKLSSKGPVFFKQLRTGKDNKEFYCYKFRTMVVNPDADKTQATKNDYRITKLGAFLRKTNLDELPQFFNVLKGEMSVVGPRPHMLLHTEEYSKKINKYMVRHLIKPGITGWAQVNGYRGNTANKFLMEKRVEHDMWYLENWSLWLDIKITFLTTWNVFKGEKNAY
ncbi:undecaprenyl-phosphate glucose phosphotransferase [Flexithrix dorotheae]|uniref:undecaprenyl-phosphate glucose phosphotransferase n=1 Tax=Flexithrix dorotheae TaxID=70993 RepID=UPI000373E675